MSGENRYGSTFSVPDWATDFIHLLGSHIYAASTISEVLRVEHKSAIRASTSGHHAKALQKHNPTNHNPAPPLTGIGRLSIPPVATSLH